MNFHPLNREDIIFLNDTAVANIGIYTGTFICLAEVEIEKQDTPFEYNIMIKTDEDALCVSYGEDKESRDMEFNFLMERKRELINV
jgi:hypothetical protein